MPAQRGCIVSAWLPTHQALGDRASEDARRPAARPRPWGLDFVAEAAGAGRSTRSGGLAGVAWRGGVELAAGG